MDAEEGKRKGAPLLGCVPSVLLGAGYWMVGLLVVCFVTLVLLYKLNQLATSVASKV